MSKEKIVYPYIPNSAPEIKAQLMKEVGVEDEMQLFEDIPSHLLLNRKMNLPEPILDEYSIKRHTDKLLSENANAASHLCFIGAGCAPHFVPAVCDEINGRSEFVTAYGAGGDHGRTQATFEYQSLMAELVDMDCLTMPQYDGNNSAACSLTMASRITGRKKVLLPKSMNPDALSTIRNYCQGVKKTGKAALEIVLVDYDTATGLLDINDLKNKISSDVAAVYIENPCYLGMVETQGEEIGKIAREAGAEFIVYTDPISLGVMEAPVNYGATITCGNLQSLGIHMQCGGGVAGFIASKDEEKYIRNFKDLMISCAPTIVEGEYSFNTFTRIEELSYGSREEAVEYTGTNAALLAITAGVYLALMGPKGTEEVGTTIMQRSQYAAKKIAEIPGVEVKFTNPFFKEFVVNFDKSGKTVKEINKKLLKDNIFGGKDISEEFSELGQSALYCVTEAHTKEDVEKLVSALKVAVSC